MKKWVRPNHNKFLVAVIVIFVFGFILMFGFSRNTLLKNEELNTLISQKNIQPILINDIGDSYTVIVYKDAKSNERLSLIAYKNRWNKIKTKQYAFGESDRASKVDVEYWGGAPYESNLIGYVGIEIINKDILEKARSVELVLDNGLVMRARFQNSNILLIPAERKYFWEKPKLKTIEIYDSNGKVLDGFYSK